MIRFHPLRAALLAGMGFALPAGAHAGTVLPAPAIDTPAAQAPQTAIFAGGCFWGIQGVFEHIKGVQRAVSGYAGGHVANPSYEQVSSGTTGDAESVRVTFDPAQVSYGTLLRIFFSVALDPTEVNRQGPDWGTQYRSVLFAANPEQDRVARAYIAQLDAAHVFPRPIATQVVAETGFAPAEAYHQDYLELHPYAPYIVINDMPKLHALEADFPQDWRAAPVLVGKQGVGS